MSDEQKAEGQRQNAVPEGWEIRAFGELADFRNGLNFLQADVGQVVKIIGVSDFQKRKSFNDISTLKEIRVKEKLRSEDILHRNDLLFVRSNGNKDLIGRCMIMDFDEESKVSFSGFTIRARFKQPILLPEITADLFTMSQVKAQIAEAGGGTNIANLSQDILAKILLPIPPLPEQRKIASILSQWDDSLSTLTKLIAAKRQQKRGLAEQLLTGKRRLPGFSEEWENLTLDEAAHIEMGTSPSSSAYNETFNGLPLIQGNADIKHRQAVPRTYTTEITKTCEVGDIILSVRAPVGSVARTSLKACIGRGVASVRSRGNQDFLYQYLEFKESAWGNLMQGSTFESVTGKEVRGFSISLPPLPEQQAIAAVLSTLDTEISSLESLKASVQRQKRGLMDVLLTGRVRVKVGGDA